MILVDTGPLEIRRPQRVIRQASAGDRERLVGVVREHVLGER